MQHSSRKSQTFPSIAKLLQSHLQCALSHVFLETLTTAELGNHTHAFMLQQEKNSLKYRSAIALAVARNQSDLAPEIAKQLTEWLQGQISPDFAQIQHLPPASIEFTLGEGAIQQWLSDGLSCICEFSGKQIASFPEYVRDRCWQLLRLGIEENIIAPCATQWKDLSWFRSSILQAPDWEFLYHLIASSDRLENVSSTQQRQKLAHRLSTAFLAFHRQCQLFNRQQLHFPEISKIRLALIAITQEIIISLMFPP